MGWEQRGNNQYFYRKEREGQKVRSIYLGRGELAHMISNLQTHSPVLERFARDLKSPEQLKVEECETVLNAGIELITMMTHGALLVGGFHTHHRQWRRTRNVGNATKTKQR
jgi:hypothetical protein